MILDYFRWTLLQMQFDLYKNFTSDVTQGNSWHMCQFFNVVYKFLVIKPKNWISSFKMFLDYTLMNVYNSARVLGPYSPRIWSTFIEILNRCNSLANKNIV